MTSYFFVTLCVSLQQESPKIEVKTVSEYERESFCSVIALAAGLRRDRNRQRANLIIEL